MGFWGRCEDLVGKYIRHQNCAFSDTFGPDLMPRIVALCMGIVICHRRKFGQVWGSPTRSRRKSPVPEGIPFYLRLPHGQNPKIGQL